MSSVDKGQTNSRYSRLSFLKRAGVGAGAAALSGGVGAVMAPRAVAARSATLSTSPTRFGRIFPSLPPFAPATDAVRASLADLGEPGGLLDAKDDLSKGPVLLITDLSLSATNRNNPRHTAGTTFFGQFVDHDITFDTTSRLGVTMDPALSANSRTPSLDLDSVYGQGPVASPQLYDPADHDKLRIDFGGMFEDLPRVDGGTNTAIIPDPRNDENLIIGGLQCAFILFHNHAVDWARDRGYKDGSTFEQARLLTTWHYHWLVVHEFLPQIVGQPMVDDVLRNGRRFYKPRMREGFIPVEFQTGAYRFGHSMVRPSYRANLSGDKGGPFFGMVFDPAGEGQLDPIDLRGGARAPRRFIGWQTFFDFGDGQVKPNKRIDTNISTPLFDLPLGAIASHDTPQALPQRNLLRHLTWSMPSGQSIAAAMRIAPIGKHDLGELKPYRFDKSTPLWYYVLKEAELIEDGLQLGPVGGRIVAEVLVGLLQSDTASYLVQKPKWTPTLTSAGSSFRMKDFLTFAGVDPASRGQ
jgi:Animal haem peroxidase